jgi:hypothetical protein
MAAGNLVPLDTLLQLNAPGSLRKDLLSVPRIDGPVLIAWKTIVGTIGISPMICPTRLP